MSDPKGRGKRKLTDEQVREIRNKDWGNWTHKDIADEYGVTAPVVQKIKAYESYRDVE